LAARHQASSRANSSGAVVDVTFVPVFAVVFIVSLLG